MEKSKSYRAFFNSRTLRQAWEGLVQKAGQMRSTTPDTLQAGDAGATWNFDTVEEFLAAYRRDIAGAYFDHIMIVDRYRFILFFTASSSETRITIKAPTRQEIEAVFNIFEDALPDSL